MERLFRDSKQKANRYAKTSLSTLLDQVLLPQQACGLTQHNNGLFLKILLNCSLCEMPRLYAKASSFKPKSETCATALSAENNF